MCHAKIMFGNGYNYLLSDASDTVWIYDDTRKRLMEFNIKGGDIALKCLCIDEKTKEIFAVGYDQERSFFLVKTQFSIN